MLRVFLFYLFDPNPRINFNEDKDVDLSNSETLKLVHELDNQGPEPEPGMYISDRKVYRKEIASELFMTSCE